MHFFTLFQQTKAKKFGIIDINRKERGSGHMYVHIGQDFIVPIRSIVCIFDMDTATWSRHTRALVQRLAKEGRTVELFDDLPRAGVLCASELGEHLYLSGLSSVTLQRLAEQGMAALCPQGAGSFSGAKNNNAKDSEKQL